VVVLRRASWAVDVVVAAICLAIDVGVLSDLSPQGWRAVVAAAAAAGGPVALLWRRRMPVAVLVVALVSGALLWVVGVAPVGHGPTVLVAIYTVATTRPQRVSLCWALGTVAAVGAHQRATWWVDGVSFAGNVVLLAGAWWMGDAARRRHEEATAHRERADQLAAARQELARRAVAEERLRIARELHDVVAHTMSAIAVQAGTGRVAFDREPAVARVSLGQIETLAREALSEMRRLLTVLRTEPGPNGEPGRSPAASLADLDHLVATSSVAGLQVEVHIEGDAHVLPTGVDLAAFRIIQEALTNVARHGGTDRAEVAVCYGDDAVVVEIDNDGPPASATGDAGGMGIVGMRERALSCGGTLVAAAKPAGGFRVVARLPLRVASAATR
jgi:signal transduction histidine kinase